MWPVNRSSKVLPPPVNIVHRGCVRGARRVIMGRAVWLHIGNKKPNVFAVDIGVIHKCAFNKHTPLTNRTHGLLLPIKALFRCVILTVATSSFANALPLIGGVPSARVELTTPNPPLTAQLDAQLKSYADSRAKTRSGTDYRRERAELLIIKKWLRSQGYYDGRAQSLAPLRYRVEPGVRYTLQVWHIESIELSEQPWPDTGLQIGQPLLAGAVLKTKDLLTHFARQLCYPRARVEYQAILDAQNHTAELTFKIDPGPLAHIQALEFPGLRNLDETYLRNEISLKSGQCLRVADLDQARLTLLQTGLLASADYSYELPEAATASESQPVVVQFTVSERKRRSVKAAVGYSTDAKAGVSLGWEHRNLFGSAEKIEIDGGVDQISHFAKAKLTLPQFFRAHQQLQFIADIDTEKPDAYTSRRRELATILSRDWSGGRRASIGVALTESRIEDGNGVDTFSLVSLPMTAALDRRDDPVDARAGWYVNLSVRPFTDLYDDLKFLQTVGSARSYFSYHQGWWQPTLALRASVGSVTGAPLTEIPADQRFYVGGGGSVRGYPYQTVGELTGGEADGGKSFAEVSVELRLHFQSDWGLVFFTDGGYAYANERPAFGEDFLWGAGLGLRYFTRFAPLRFDIATPLNRRDGVDNPLQLYISFGQAF